MPVFTKRRDPACAGPPAATSTHRSRLVDAITRAAAEHGYAKVDVEQVAFYAGLSVDDFYASFESKDQCLLAAYDNYLRRLLSHIAAAGETLSDWPAQVAASVSAGLGFVAELGPVSRTFAIDALSVGPAAIEQRFAAIERGARFLRRGRELYPAAAELPASLEQTLVAGQVFSVSMQLLAEEPLPLPRLRSEMVELLLSPYVGAERARLLGLEAAGDDRSADAVRVPGLTQASQSA